MSVLERIMAALYRRRIPTVLYGEYSLKTMETTAIIALVLLVVSEILPYTPLKGNGLVQEIVEVLKTVFPHKSDTDV